MTDFLATLQSMLGGQQPSPAGAQGGLIDYGAAPTAQGVLPAMLSRFGGAPASAPGPLGITSGIGGSSMGAAAAGLRAVDPASSKFGAFAQGLAGGLAAREQAAVQDRQLGILQQHAGLQAAKQAMELQQMQRQMAGADAAARALGLGPSGLAGAPAQASAASGMPTTTLGPGGPASAAALQGGGTQPGGAPTMPGSAGPVAAPSIPLANMPGAIMARVGKLNAAADAALAGGNPDLGAKYQARAAQEQQRAQAMLDHGKTLDSTGAIVDIPGFVKSETDVAGAKKAAELAAENAAKPTMDPSGAAYVGGAPTPASSAPRAPTIGNTPAKAALDPDTAAVTSSIPSAPPGGGYPMPNLPAGAKLVGVGENAKETAKADAQFDDLVGKAPQIDSGIERYKAAAQALKLFQSGSGAERLNAGAALAASYGYPDIAKAIQGGDPAALQWLNKEGVGLTLDTLKAAQPRFAQAEFNKVAEKGVPSPDNLPQANHQLITEGLGQMLRNQAFVRDWQMANKQGWTSPSAFYTAWSAANPADTFLRSAQRQIGTFKGMSPPPTAEWTVGSTYVAPSSMSPAAQAAFAKRGVQPGQLFRFNGSKAAQAITPVPAAQGFSDHLTGGP